MLTEPPQPDGLRIAVRSRPAAREAQVGGDWYDAFLSRDGATILVVGDVTGHDVDAAAITGRLRNRLRGITHALDGDPAQVLTTLDRAVVDLGVGTLATALVSRPGRTQGRHLGRRVARAGRGGSRPAPHPGRAACAAPRSRRPATHC